jgi:hypothetical protein
VKNLSYYLGMDCSVHVDVFAGWGTAYISCSDGDCVIELGVLSPDDIQILWGNGIEVYEEED